METKGKVIEEKIPVKTEDSLKNFLMSKLGMGKKGSPAQNIVLHNVIDIRTEKYHSIVICEEKMTRWFVEVEA